VFVEVVRFADSASDVGDDAFSPGISPRAADRLESLRRTGGIHRQPTPLPARIGLALAVFLLGGAVLAASVQAVNASARLIADAAMSDDTLAGSDLESGLATPRGFVAPRLVGPSEVFTNSPTFSLTGTLGSGIAGTPGYVVRVYRDAPGPTPVHVVAVGRIPWFHVADIPLADGSNTFIATLVGPAGETAPSNQVTVVFGTAKPQLTLTAPARGAKVADRTVTVMGTVSAGAFVVVRNTANGNGGVAATTADGVFRATVGLASGANTILVTATDRAGNSTVVKATLNRVRSARPSGGGSCGSAKPGQRASRPRPAGGTTCPSGTARSTAVRGPLSAPH
jgi:hypothetical protein